MSIGEFKKSIKNESYLNAALNEALYIWRNYKKYNFKEEFALEKYTKCPSVFIHDIISKFISLYDQQKILGKKTDFGVVEETEDWILVNAKSIQSFKYFAHSYLRQDGDKEEFGSGPSWCIASSSAKNYWNNYCGSINSPLSYILLSKHDSTKRFAIVLDEIVEKMNTENDACTPEAMKEILIELINNGLDLRYLSMEIRGFNNEDVSENINEILIDEFDTTETNILNSILYYLQDDFEINDDYSSSKSDDVFENIYSRYTNYFDGENFNLLDIVKKYFSQFGINQKDIPWSFVTFYLQLDDEDLSMWNLKKSFKISFSEMASKWPSFKENLNLQQTFYETLFMILIQNPEDYSSEILKFIKSANYVGLKLDTIENNIKSIKPNRRLEEEALKYTYKNQLLDKYNFKDVFEILDENQNIQIRL